ncbi:RcnB family protein [Herminiimonas sp.]|uniref:RcnB family protein n=1 Tax=Herminiimonas sp. TaxID=1926289 RepID=UPI00271C540E|nr:RcnB family protein [Herminiimonas sp.]MDO8304326.1 RcnB family protein [Herminiimonas sp.]
MNKKIIIATIMAISLTAGSSAYAQGHGHGNDRDRNSHGQHDRSDRDDDHGKRYNQRDNHARGHDNGRHNGRGAGPQHNFYKGERISSEYRHRQYVVNDWRGHRLSAPPRGYHWVQTGPDYVLIAITTGIIAQIIFSN